MSDRPDAGTAPAVPNKTETRPKALAEWLQRLPFASPPDTAQQLVAALRGLNGQSLGGDDRLALLALYRPVLARTAASLEALLADAGVPPTAQQRQIGTLLRALHSEHANGYRHALQALTQRRFGRPDPKRLAEAASRQLAALHHLQSACDLTHAPPPAGLWQDMHQLHSFARASNLADHAVNDAPPVSVAYSQALLFALADPPCLNHAEIVHTRHYLDRFAGLTRLGSAPGAARGLAIRFDGDTPPIPAAASEADSRLWLDTEALCRQLRDTATRLRAGTAPDSLGLPAAMGDESGQALCKHLLRQWSAGTQRVFRRFATPGSTVQVVAGISAIHRLLEQMPPPPQQDPLDPDSVLIHDVGVTRAPIAVNATDWEVRNDSATGLALSGTPDAPLSLRVGDVLALRAGQAPEWSLGAIRWIRMRDARQVELGVERLSPQIHPVWVRPLRGQFKTNPEPALLVPGLDTLKQQDRLLLPRDLYQSGMDAEVWHAPNQYTLSFGKRIEQTPSFDLIDFTIFAGAQP